MVSDPSASHRPSASPQIHRADYEAAALRVQERVSFYGHLTWYFWLNLFFLATNSFVTPGQWWAAPIAIGWGFLLFIHMISVFFIGDLNGPFRRRLLRREAGGHTAREEPQEGASTDD